MNSSFLWSSGEVTETEECSRKFKIVPKFFEWKFTSEGIRGRGGMVRDFWAFLQHSNEYGICLLRFFSYFHMTCLLSNPISHFSQFLDIRQHLWIWLTDLILLSFTQNFELECYQVALVPSEGSDFEPSLGTCPQELGTVTKSIVAVLWIETSASLLLHSNNDLITCAINLITCAITG